MFKSDYWSMALAVLFWCGVAGLIFAAGYGVGRWSVS